MDVAINHGLAFIVEGGFVPKNLPNVIDWGQNVPLSTNERILQFLRTFPLRPLILFLKLNGVQKRPFDVLWITFWSDQ
jgi:hypothetical protein